MVKEGLWRWPQTGRRASYPGAVKLISRDLPGVASEATIAGDPAGGPDARKDSLILSDLAGDVVWLVCDKCGRKGRYRVAGLIGKYGADKKLTYLRAEIADCPKAYTASSQNIYDICGARLSGHPPQAMAEPQSIDHQH